MGSGPYAEHVVNYFAIYFYRGVVKCFVYTIFYKASTVSNNYCHLICLLSKSS